MSHTPLTDPCLVIENRAVLEEGICLFAITQMRHSGDYQPLFAGQSVRRSAESETREPDTTLVVG